MLVLDRFEGSFAVIELSDGSTFNLPRELLPSSAKEGDVLRINVEVDETATAARRKRIESLAEELFES